MAGNGSERSVSFGVCMVFLSGCVTWTHGADLSTDDGLTLRLGEATGTAEAMQVDGRALPPLEAARAGLWWRELRSARRHDPEELWRDGFEKTQGPWAGVVNPGWELGEDATVVRRTDGGAEGSECYLRLGDKRRYGHGVTLGDRVPVRPGGLYEIAWAARVPSHGATYILYIRVLDAAGKDIANQVPAPDGWSYSRWSNTHFVCRFGPKTTNAWEQMSRVYVVPEGVAYLRIALCLWRGDHVDVDSLRLAGLGDGGWSDRQTLQGPLTPKPDANAYEQRVSPPSADLAFRVRYAATAGCIRVEGEVADTSRPARDRAVQVACTLPMNATGWAWWESPAVVKTVNRAVILAQPSQTPSFSAYPFSSLTRDDVGLSYCVPMDAPRFVRMTVNGKTGGCEICFDLALTQASKSPGRASFQFGIYRHNGRWGMRTAAKKYYDLFPQFFVKRVTREGLWLHLTDIMKVPHPDDFGIVFDEGPRNTVRWDNEHGIYAFKVCTAPMEHWYGVPGEHDEAPSLSVEDAVAQSPPHTLWQRILDNAGAKDCDGRWLGGYTITCRRLYGGSAKRWALMAITNCDPDLPLPNAASKRLDKLAQFEARCRSEGLDLAGAYVDNVTWSSVLNYRRDHHRRCDVPLVFSHSTGELIQPLGWCLYDFCRELADRMHKQGKLTMGNLVCERMFAHLFDVGGSEVHEAVGGESAQRSLERRMLMYQKPIGLLWARSRLTEPPTHAEMEAYMDRCLLYGLFPSISWACKNAEAQVRYFAAPELYERDRPLFKKYVPLIRRICRAGWEPVTYARANDKQVLVERFGRWSQGELFFTVRNEGDKKKRRELSVQLVSLGVKGRDLSKVSVQEVSSGSRLPVRSGGPAGIIRVQMELPPARTTVIRVMGKAEQGRS